MIFILFFGMTMRSFASVSVGSLREDLFGPYKFYYAITTQKSFFGPKKACFFKCHASGFDYATLFFMDFGLLFLA